MTCQQVMHPVFHFARSGMSASLMLTVGLGCALSTAIKLNVSLPVMTGLLTSIFANTIGAAMVYLVLSSLNDEIISRRGNWAIVLAGISSGAPAGAAASMMPFEVVKQGLPIAVCAGFGVAVLASGVATLWVKRRQG